MGECFDVYSRSVLFSFCAPEYDIFSHNCVFMHIMYGVEVFIQYFVLTE